MVLRKYVHFGWATAESWLGPGNETDLHTAIILSVKQWHCSSVQMLAKITHSCMTADQQLGSLGAPFPCMFAEDLAPWYT